MAGLYKYLNRFALILLMMATGFVLVSAPALSEGLNSRLNSLIRNPVRVYMPSRLLIGQENRFTVQGRPGNQVILYFSPKSGGGRGPSGEPIRVGEESQRIVGTIPDKGVLQLMLPLPEDETLVGVGVFVEALTWSLEDYSDLEVLPQMDATGRATSDNHLVVEAPTDGKGVSVMPSMPGVSPQLFNRLTSLSEMKDDERKKELLEDYGKRESETLYDRNQFINRPDKW